MYLAVPQRCIFRLVSKWPTKIAALETIASHPIILLLKLSICEWHAFQRNHQRASECFQHLFFQSRRGNSGLSQKYLYDSAYNDSDYHLFHLESPLWDRPLSCASAVAVSVVNSSSVDNSAKWNESRDCIEYSG